MVMVMRLILRFAELFAAISVRFARVGALPLGVGVVLVAINTLLLMTVSFFFFSSTTPPSPLFDRSSVGSSNSLPARASFATVAERRLTEEQIRNQHAPAPASSSRSLGAGASREGGVSVEQARGGTPAARWCVESSRVLRVVNQPFCYEYIANKYRVLVST